MGPNTKRWRAVALAGAVAALFAASATAQQAGRQPRENRPGEYSGVKPGDGYPGRVKRRKNTLTWVGFQPREGGGSRLFVQLTSEMPYRQDVAGDVLIVLVEGARYGTRNARRRLDTRFFDSAIAGVTSKRVRRIRARGDRPERPAGIQLTITFKNKADVAAANARLAEEKDGFHYLYLDFGPPAGDGSVRVSDEQ